MHYESFEFSIYIVAFLLIGETSGVRSKVLSECGKCHFRRTQISNIFRGGHAPAPPRWMRLTTRGSPPPPMLTSCARHWEKLVDIAEIVNIVKYSEQQQQDLYAMPPNEYGKHKLLSGVKNPV